MKEHSDLKQIPKNTVMNINFMHQNHYLPIAKQTIKTKKLTSYKPNQNFMMKKSNEGIKQPAILSNEVFDALRYPLPNWIDKKLLTVFVAEAFRDGDNPKREVILDTRYIAQQLSHTRGLDSKHISELREHYVESISRWWGCRLYFRNWYNSPTEQRGRATLSIIGMIFVPNDGFEIVVYFTPEFMEVCKSKFRVMIDTKQYLNLSSPIAARVYETILVFRPKWGIVTKGGSYQKIHGGDTWKIKESTLMEKLFLNQSLSNLPNSAKRRNLRKAIEEASTKLDSRYLLEDGVYSFYLIEGSKAYNSLLAA